MPKPVRKPIEDKDSFSVFKFGEEGEDCLYTVTRLGDPPMTFIAILSRTQAAFAKPSDIEAIKAWCARQRDLPPAESSIRINLRA